MGSSALAKARRRSAAEAVAALVAGAAVLAGCGGTATSREGADTTHGKELFTQKCGQCHVLADAGTAGQVGPNLDNAFGYSRRQGYEDSTFFEVTLTQMRIPAPPMPDFDDRNSKNYLSDRDRLDIAAYVASVAGKPGKQAAGAQSSDPKAIFTASCGSCHTLGDAGTQGTVGPNLDDTKPSLERAVAQITNGGGGMPAFKDQLTEEQIRKLAQYVVKATGGR